MTPAPVKNPNVPNKMSGSSTTTPNSSSTSSFLVNSTTAASSSSSGGRKQTGTVPKSTTATKPTSTTSVNTEMQHGQKPILQQPPGVVAQQANRCSPLVASIQQQQHTRHPHQQQQHKNTEIVAPIRRELKDLNDYLLTTVVTTANTTNNNTTLLQQQQSIGAGSTNSDIENSQENQQRFCYPVRPIPRRNQPQSQHQAQQTQNDFLLNPSANSVNSNLNTTIGVVIPTTPGLPAAANTVQPTINTNANVVTNSTQLNDNQSAVLGPQFEQQIQLIVLQRLRQLFENSQTSPFLNLTTSILPGIQASSSSSLANTILNHNTNEITQLAQRFQNLNNNPQKSNLETTANLPPTSQQKTIKSTAMVHEINNPNSSSQHDVVVNSTSLEDVPHSDHMSDRAQSIQSLHSNIETPTPDTTPSYEELQQRLEASNRNIQNMQEQQQQLLKLQNAAKQHLTDMEKLRQQAGGLSFPSGSQRGADGGDGAPEYQSIDQVHSDMASLVGRMKNLTSFIQNQNELSNLLGDDGPEILAEQEALHRKLESLRAQRDEMRNLVCELQSVNRSAEESAKEARQRQFEQEKDIEENDQEHAAAATAAKSKKSSNNEREVPVEFTRNVPIELLQQAQRPQAQQQLQTQRPQMNGNEHSETETDMDDDERKETADLIQQKVADIEAMKAQLKRLKDMMETVNLIEAHAVKDPAVRSTTTAAARDVPITYDRERTPVQSLHGRYNDDNGNEEFLTRKVRMLNDVTSDLRAQAQSLQAEKDRIQMLKDEIERRKNQAAAAVKIGDEALKRNSLTPTPVPRSSHEERWEEHLKTQHERDQLKEEYERKKKEFEVICKRLEQEDTPNQQTPRTTRQDIVSEADDEAEEDNIESDYAESAKFVPTSTPATSRNNENNSNARTGKDSLNSTGVSSNTGTHIAQAASSSAHDGASLEAASLQSGSSRSFSIPPPMINFPGPIPPPLPTAWNPYYYSTGVPPPPPPPQTAYGLTQATSANSAVPLSNNECICTANLGAATSSSTATSAATNNGTSLATDPMLQQFIQTQQMLINSVCQCNQMLWHQQREIDNLNQTIHILQERLIAIGGPANVNNSDVGYTLRSESVPPPSLGGIPTNQALPNNLYMTINRAQSEQPALYIPPGQHRNSGFGNYQQQQQQQQQHHHHIYRRVSQQQHQPQATGVGYNFSAETQQHNSSSSASAMYSLNNATAPQAAPTTLFNNEIPTPPSPVVGSGGPAPIFMHHHNNSIHQNNANLRTQNQQQQHHHSNVTGTLNNQVPPGNRANNYWDNFRSYSRQNLLSTNSTKSNEEQQQQQQQQQQQHNQPEATNYERPQSMQQHPSQQQQQQQLYHEPNPNLEDNVNNLNYAVTPNNEASSKYLRILQRSRINQQQQQQQYQQNATYQHQREFLQQLNWLEQQQQQQENNNSCSNTTANAAAAASTNNSTDLMYHNYNIQQNNKVGPKPNWRFRNLNEDYQHSVNRVQQSQQQQQSLPRYQNTASFPRAQQQQQQTTLAQANTQFLNLPQTQGRNHDFLVQANEGPDQSYNFLNTSQQLPLDFSSTNAQNIIPSECNENNEDEEDDTTSEEIKRNLLVNALKNDKFTTKFYESIKEDVFRRLESMLLDKDNVPQTHTDVMPQLFNNINNHSLRKLNLNEQRDQMQQQQHLQQHQLSSAFDATTINLQQQNVSDDSNTRNDFPRNPANDENCDNENEKPEEDTNWRQNNMNNCANSNSSQQTGGSTSTTTTTTTTTKNCTKKRKNLRKQPMGGSNNHNTVSSFIAATAAAAKEDDHQENLRGACSLAAQNHHNKQQGNKDKQNENKNANEAAATTSPTNNLTSSVSSSILTSSHANESDLIKYIISRIRNQTHPNTLINDALLVEVAKLTATVAQNAQPLTNNHPGGVVNNSNNISPKKIYTKIKKLTIPKERDEFLSWYQQYLENTLFGNQAEMTKTKSSAAKATNHQVQVTTQQNGAMPLVPQSPTSQPPPPQQDDGDLAEADQNCSSNTSANYHHLDDADATNTLIITTKADVDNFENPNKLYVTTQDNNLEGACALVTSSSNQMDELTPTAAVEKNDLKSEKQDYNEKE